MTEKPGKKPDSQHSIDSEQKLALFQRRKGMKSVLTRRRNELSVLMVDEKNCDEIRHKLPSIQTALENFYEAQDEYHSTITDIDEAEKSEEYGEEVENTCAKFQVEVNRWLKSVEDKVSYPDPEATSTDGAANSIADCLDKLMKQQITSTNALLLPKTEVPVYDGNPIDYPDFIRAFENIVEAQTDKDTQRLYYLLQYTKGEVKELIKSCLSMPDSQGYKQARVLLKKMYGQNYKIAAAYSNKITEGPSIKADDGTALRKLAVTLISSANVLKEIGYENKLNNPDTLRKIIGRLPYGLRSKWRIKADNISEEENREIRLEDVALFVEQQARVATHPIFGNIADSKDSEKRRPPTTRTRAFVTQSEDTQRNAKLRSCPLCSGDHLLMNCANFKQMPVEERSKFAKVNVFVLIA